jgi:2-dehydro-3-deoxygluconokinase
MSKPSQGAQRDLVVLGEALVGLVPDGHGVVRRSDTLRRFTVGAEVNVAVAASRLGHRVSWIGRVGEDLSGEAILDDLRREGVLLDHVRSEVGSPTGLLFREKSPLGATRVSYARKASAGSLLSEDDIEEKFVALHRMAHVSGVTPALSPSAHRAAEKFLQVARDAGVTTVLDMNYRSKLWSPEEAGPALAGLARFADIVIGGASEWSLVFGGDDLATLSLPSASVLVRTDGPRPVTALVEGKLISQETIATQVVDVVGAGDAFVGGVLSALLAGADWPSALRQGTYCGARVVSSFGDWTNLPWGTHGLVLGPLDEQEVLR